MSPLVTCLGLYQPQGVDFLNRNRRRENKKETGGKIIKSTLQMFTGHYGIFAGFPCCGETLYHLQIAGKSYNYHGISLQSVNITQHT